MMWYKMIKVKHRKDTINVNLKKKTYPKGGFSASYYKKEEIFI